MPRRRPEQEWAAIEAQWRESGKVIEVFSKERHISPGAFRKYLKRKDAIQDIGFVEVKAPDVVRDLRSGITLVLPEGLRIEVGPNVDPGTLETALRVLKAL